MSQFIAYDAAQVLTEAQKLTARTNIGAEKIIVKKSAFNVNFGIAVTDAATGNHSHTIMNPIYTLGAGLSGKLVALTSSIDTKTAEIAAHRKELIAVENQMVEFWKDSEKSKALGKRYSELEELILEARLTLAEAKGSKGALTFISAVAPEMITTNPNT